jgi:hypothetical protein
VAVNFIGGGNLSARVENHRPVFTDAGCFSPTISSVMVYFDTLSHDLSTDLNSEFLLETNINIKMFRLNLPINLQNLSHNVVSSTPRLSGIRTHNFSGDQH